ncbi:nucleotidyltransferase domain-containing protein [Wenzhouxiangella sp. EGI_FJ10409]|uniref:nucleotidyltransferase domain-containing protein n=1 Tax=Wenzhouxiangella sp. EGI_FJ10409 TaxID=3243767 RepID=UPI0035E0D217
MRLTDHQIETIKQATAEIFGPDAQVWLFGSRADDSRRGGDVDLMVETADTPANPAMLAARLSARVSRSMYGRHVDVVVHAKGVPEQSIHKAARTQGTRL